MSGSHFDGCENGGKSSSSSNSSDFDFVVGGEDEGDDIDVINDVDVNGVDTSQKKINELQNKIIKLEEELEWRKKENNTIADDRKMVMKERDLWKEQCGEVVKQRDDFEKQVNHLFRENLNMKCGNKPSKLDELKHERDKLAEMNSELINKIDELYAKNLAHEDETTKLCIKNLMYEDKIADLRVKHEEEIERYKRKADDLQEKVENRENEDSSKNISEGKPKNRALKLFVLFLGITWFGLCIAGTILAEALLMKCLYFLCNFIGAYLVKRLCDIKTSKHQQNGLDGTLNSDMHQRDLNNPPVYDQNQIQNNINGQNMNYNYENTNYYYTGMQQSLYPVFSDDNDQDVDLPSMHDVEQVRAKQSEQINNSSALEVDNDFFPMANRNEQPAQNHGKSQKSLIRL